MRYFLIVCDPLWIQDFLLMNSQGRNWTWLQRSSARKRLWLTRASPKQLSLLLPLHVRSKVALNLRTFWWVATVLNNAIVKSLSLYRKQWKQDNISAASGLCISLCFSILLRILISLQASSTGNETPIINCLFVWWVLHELCWLDSHNISHLNNSLQFVFFFFFTITYKVGFNTCR